MGGFLEIGFLRVVNVPEFLRVTVDKGKPGALDLDHDSVSFAETMAFIPQVILDFCHFTGNERLRMFVTVPVLSPVVPG